MSPWPNKRPSWQNNTIVFPEQPARPKPGSMTVPADFQIDPETRFHGVVESYHKWQGYGFISLMQKGVVPEDRLFVMWNNIQTEDRFPFLCRGMDVEFGIMTWKDKGQTRLRAKYVTNPGGHTIALQDDFDAAEKSFVGGQYLRYSGVLKSFDPGTGIGWVILDDGFALEEPVPKELKVTQQEVNAGGKRVRSWLKNIKVEFGIWKTRKGEYQVYNMTLPESRAITDDALENRKKVSLQAYTGKVTWWSRKEGWGHILPDHHEILPAHVTAKIAEAAAKAKAKSGQARQVQDVLYFKKPDLVKGTYPKEGLEVTFQVYVDDKGAGACDVSG